MQRLLRARPVRPVTTSRSRSSPRPARRRGCAPPPTSPGRLLPRLAAVAMLRPYGDVWRCLVLATLCVIKDAELEKIFFSCPALLVFFSWSCVWRCVVLATCALAREDWGSKRCGRPWRAAHLRRRYKKGFAAADGVAVHLSARRQLRMDWGAWQSDDGRGPGATLEAPQAPQQAPKPGPYSP